MMRIFRLAFFAGLMTVALMVLPATVRTTYAAECQCSSASSEQASCSACVTSCASTGGMTRFGTVAGTSCGADGNVDPASVAAPAVETTPEAPASGVAAGNVQGCDELSLAGVKCNLLLFIADILNIIASFLGKVLIFMVDILISFASYNGFGDATVVHKGWVVVRDVVNMFFIIVLLISAFATIIGYEHSFHYKQVLPKLLLMAVLINFSRTLIQLLIDFSQVIMLTFVNAFASAGPGNLVSALKLDRVLAMAPPQGGGGTASVIGAAGLTGTVDSTNIILALMLGIFMLSISLGVVVIMTAYLIVRIVGLWIALILSPIALFATALPARMQKGISQFSSKYWTKLSAMLTGGPVMAFFLWLTFAITQASAGSPGGLAQAVNIQTNNPAVSFLTSIGNSQDIASFIVGITLLLMGLEAAVSAAESVSKTLGKYAAGVSSASQGLGKLAATLPFWLTAKGAGAGAKYVDRRTDISGRAASAAFALTSKIPILKSYTRAPLIAAMGYNKNLDKKEAAAEQAGLEGLSLDRKKQAAAGTANRFLKTKGMKAAYVQQMSGLADEKNSKAFKDQLMPGAVADMTKLRKKELENDGLSGDALKAKLAEDAGMIKNRASQKVDQSVAKEQASRLADARKMADKMGDQDAVRQIDDQIKKNPHLAEDRDKQAKALLTDPNALNAISDTAQGDMGFLYSLLEQSKAVVTDPATGKTSIDRAKLDNFTGKIKNKDLKTNIEMMTKLMRGSPGKYNKENIQGMTIGKNEKGQKRIFEAGFGSTQEVQSESAIAAGKAFRASPTDVPTIQNALREIPADQVFANNDSLTAIQDVAENDVAKLAKWEVVESTEPVRDSSGNPMRTPGTPANPAGDVITKKVTRSIDTATGAAVSRKDVDPKVADFELLASKIEDMASPQRTKFAATMAKAGAVNVMVNCVKMGFTDPERIKTFIKVGQVLRSESDAIKHSGVKPAAGSDEEYIQTALKDLQEAISKKENSSVSSALGHSIAPKEEA
ncbi:MAG: hypothetical protein WCK01_02835 [Candidatus Uhrbacteria bacterium]